MLGARRHYAVPRLLQEAGYLERFFTDSYVGNKPWLKNALELIPDSLSPRAIRAWRSRDDLMLDKHRVHSYEMLGIWYAWERMRARTPDRGEWVALETAKRFNRWIARRGLGEADAVWGFGAAAPELFAFARKSGKKCILEQIILPKVIEDTLLQEERDRWADWTEASGVRKSRSLMDGRQEMAWALADVIVAGSGFVGEGLRSLGVAPEKIRVIPYGVDPLRFQSPLKGTTRAAEERSLRVLFSGAVGLRKGVPDLLHALRFFNPGEMEARFAGGIELKQEKLQPFRPWAEFLGPIPRPRMAEMFQWADVFVLPSIVEGSATVIYEALMSGCPVITTPNAGSIVRDGVDGFVVPIRSPEALAATLRRYVDEPGLLEAHREQVRRDRQRAGLERYKDDLVRLIQGLGNS